MMQRIFFGWGAVLSCVTSFAAAHAGPVTRDLYTQFTIEGKSFLDQDADVHSSADGLYIMTPGGEGYAFPEGQKIRVQLYPDPDRGPAAHRWCYQRVDWAKGEAAPAARPICPAPKRSELVVGDDGKTVIGMLEIDPEKNVARLYRNTSPARAEGTFVRSAEYLELKVRIATEGVKTRFDTSLSIYDAKGSRTTSFDNAITHTNAQPDVQRPKIVQLDLAPGKHFQRKRGYLAEYELRSGEGVGSPTGKTGADDAKTRR